MEAFKCPYLSHDQAHDPIQDNMSKGILLRKSRRNGSLNFEFEKGAKLDGGDHLAVHRKVKSSPRWRTLMLGITIWSSTKALITIHAYKIGKE